ncbi:sensor histidine kinase [Phenylobacterium sp.]|jgi:nitrogen fixation/metabolism regulation signal transduction histidine kinase|uniref:sensor histidine kinase n=1 Tax=Phenylobacterium sp. TaxID=1871053 RepID=UPI002F426FE7
MASKRLAGAGGFALSAGLRAVAISALAFGAFLALERHLWATTLVLLGAIVLVALDLMRSIGAADRTLAQFVEGVTAEGYERPTIPAGFSELGAAIRGALDRLAALRAERQQRADFLEALADTVSAALLVLDEAGAVTGVNRAARMALAASPGPLAAIPALGTETAARLIALPAGAREIVRLADQRAMLATVTGFTAAGGARRLIALQSLAGDLDAVELKAWQDLVRVLAHEMMNSLTPICSLSESIAGRLAEPHGAGTDAEVIEAAQVIARRSAGLMTFVERYRQLTDGPAVVKARINGADFVRRLDRLAEAMIGEARVAWASAVQPAWLTLEADPDLLEQAAINLVKNAIDAVRDRPDGRVRLSLALEEDQVVLSVADNGPGLPSGDPEGVFVPFFTTKPGGSGIGLSLARQIALSHGGRLGHQAATPGGAVFRLSLPI